jgi:hypothetical protein
LAALRPGGLILLDQGPGHEPDNVSALGPFGACFEVLSKFVATTLAPDGAVIAHLDMAGHRG